MGRWIWANNDVPFDRKFYFGEQNSGDIELFGGDQYHYHYCGCLCHNVRYEPSDISTIENRLSSLSSTIKEITGRDVLEWFTDGISFMHEPDGDRYGLTTEYWTSFKKCKKNIKVKEDDLGRWYILDILLHDHIKRTWDKNGKNGESTKKLNMKIIPVDHLHDCPMKDWYLKEGKTSIPLTDNDVMYCVMYLCMTYELGMEILNTIKKYSEFTLSYEY